MQPQPPQEEAPLDWQAAANHFQQQAKTTKSITFRDLLGPGRHLTFQYRQLTQDEADHAERIAVEIENTRRGSDVKIHAGEAKRYIARTCITSGPDGWRSTEANVRLLPPDVLEAVVDAIKKYSSMPPEQEEAWAAFRQG